METDAPPQDPVSLNEIMDNISKRNFTGRNSFGHGIRNDIEELMGWHLDDQKTSPLSEQDRIRILRQINSSATMLSPEMTGSDLKTFLEEKIRELSINEATRYLNERETKLNEHEDQRVAAKCDQIKSLESEKRAKTPGTVKRPAGDPLSEQKLEVDALSDNIESQKFELYKLVFENLIQKS